MNESIRERYRYFKRKRSKVPSEWTAPSQSTTIANDAKHLMSSCERVNYPNGAILYRKIFTNDFMEGLASACLRDFPFRHDSITNIEKLGKESFERAILNAFTPDTELAKSKLKDLRWTTLGYHHNWDSKEYDEQKKGEMPEVFEELGAIVATLLELDTYQPQAAIVNYYPAGVGYIGIHRDNSEYCNAPIVSVSIGATAVFLLGLGERDEPCVEIRLEHGDLLVMDGKDREALHAVPRVMPEPNIPCKDAQLRNYLSQARINVNLRQVT